MPSRRRVLAGAGALAIAGATGAASRVKLDPVDTWRPAADTWPMARFDPANTGTNHEASIPANPAVDWRRAVLGSTHLAALVAGPDGVYASDVGNSQRTTALDRDDGTVRWEYRPIGGYLALYGEELYVGTDTSISGAELFAFETADGAVRWKGNASGTDHLVAADDTLLLGGGGDVSAYGTGDGSRRWRVDGERVPTGVALGADGLYAVVGERLAEVRPRTWLDAALERSPPVAWRTDRIDDLRVPAVWGDRLVAGSTVETRVSDETPRSAVTTYDATTGDPGWGAFRSDAVADPPGPSVLHATTPVVTDEIGVTALEYAGEFRADPSRWEGDHPPIHSVAGLSLADGSVRWRRGFDRPIRDVAATGNAVLIGSGTLDGGTITALDAPTGDERWRIDLGTGVDVVAPVDGAVFAATLAGEVVALR